MIIVIIVVVIVIVIAIFIIIIVVIIIVVVVVTVLLLLLLLLLFFTGFHLSFSLINDEPETGILTWNIKEAVSSKDLFWLNLFFPLQ